jgi:hypothetical protein
MPRIVHLQSSAQLRGLLAELNNYVLGLPTGRELRVQSDRNVFRAGEIVANETKVIKAQKREIFKVADSELSQQGITQASADQISAIKESADVLASKGHMDLIENMQAVTDILVNY